MYRMIAATSLLMGMTLATPVFGESLADPQLCSLRTVMQCEEMEGCSRVLPGQVNLPNFFQLHLDRAEILAVGGRRDGSRTPIERQERFAGRTLLQGGDLHEEVPNGGVGWSMIVDHESGWMSLSALTPFFSLVAYGKCIDG
ncbi:MAG: hypothetical protein ACXIUM_14880 [Wenzhouxiangella sp.]